jgi:hypothetical protein
MFEDALLESSPRRRGVLCRVHYTLSIFTGVLFFALGFKLVRFLLPPADERALFVIAAMLGVLPPSPPSCCAMCGQARNMHMLGRGWR